MNWKDKETLRIFAVDGVSVTFEKGILLVTVEEADQIKAEEQDDGSWVLIEKYPMGWKWVGEYSSIPALWEEIDNSLYMTIKEWYVKHSNNLSALFVGLR